MIKLLLSILLLSCPFVNYGQFNGPFSHGIHYGQVSKLYIHNPLTLRINYLGLVDLLDGNISLGAEYRISPNVSAGLDAAIVIYSLYYLENSITSGFIARPFVRYYPDGDNSFFLDLELHYKKVRYSAADTTNKNVFRKEAMGIHVKAGKIIWISSTIGFEYYIGFGLRWKNQGKVMNDGVIESNTHTSLFRSPHYFGPVIPAGARLLINF